MARLLLLVDDAATRGALLQHLAADHTVLTAAAGGPEGGGVGAVLVDADNLERLREPLQHLRSGDAALVPVLLLAPREAIDSLSPATWHAVDDVLAMPPLGPELDARLRTALDLHMLSAAHARRGDGVATLGMLLDERVRSRTRQMRKSVFELAVTLAAAAQQPDPNAARHLRRIGHLAKTLAEDLGLDPAFQDSIFHASPLYDIGTVAVPRELLARPGPLKGSEWRAVQAHALAGEAILSAADTPYAAMGAQIAAGHHERWDGSGYPRGLAGSRIPLAARIVALCDVYDSARRERPYHGARDHQAAVEVLTRGDGRSQPAQFDPAVLAAFGKAQGRFRDVFETFAPDRTAAPAGGLGAGGTTAGA